MTEAQSWVLIGVFATALFGMLTIVSTMFVRILRSEVGRLGERLDGRIGGLHAEMSARFDGVDRRIDALDRDVSALVKHTFGIDRG